MKIKIEDSNGVEHTFDLPYEDAVSKSHFSDGLCGIDGGKEHMVCTECHTMKHVNDFANPDICEMCAIKVGLYEPNRTIKFSFEGKNNWKCFFGFHIWVKDKEETNGHFWRFCDRCGGRQISRQCGASDEWVWRWG